MKKSFSFFILTFGLLIMLSDTLFVINQTEQAIVLQFGEFKRIHKSPGLKIKVPFLQEVIRYEKRVLDYDLPPVPLTTGDRKRLVVDTYTRYKIADPIKFLTSIKPATEFGARLQLEDMISSTLRNVLGKVSVHDLLSVKRSQVMSQIEDEVRRLAEPLGIEIVDVGIVRAELPLANREVVFAEMNSKLIELAKTNRATGSKDAVQIRSEAERDRTILLAEAEKESRRMLGEAEAKALEIVGKALERNPELYAFRTAWETYADTLNEETVLVLGTANDLLKYFTEPNKLMK